MIQLLTVLGLFVLANSAMAFECKVQRDGKAFSVEVSPRGNQVTLRLNDAVKITKTIEAYDGRSNYSLITGEGVSITFENWYGRIHNVNLVAAITLLPSGDEVSTPVGRISFPACE